jgi:hypothetical protein
MNATQSCAKDGTSPVGVDTKSIFDGGTAAQCYWGAPWNVSETLSYGFAAFNGNNCGKCYQLDFTGSGPNGSSAALKGKSMIVQAINFGNIGANHFDLLIPGGGVGDHNCCNKDDNSQWGKATDLGPVSGGFLAGCSRDMSCVQTKCQSVFGSKPALLAGCNWFVDWFKGADNPNVIYKEVPCPAELKAKSKM